MEPLKIAELTPEKVAKLTKLEDEFGFQLMAFEFGVKFAEPTAAQLEKIKELEKELNITLLAFNFE